MMEVMVRVIRVLNFCLAFGDAVLPSESDYGTVHTHTHTHRHTHLSQTHTHTHTPCHSTQMRVGATLLCICSM